MANFIQYDPLDIVPNRVTRYLQSVETSLYEGQPNTLKNPDLSAVAGIPIRQWKVVGESVVPITAPELATLDAGDTASNLERRRQIIRALRDSEDMSLILESLVRVMLAEVNSIRAATAFPLSARTFNQVRNAFVAQLDSLIAALE